MISIIECPRRRRRPGFGTKIVLICGGVVAVELAVAYALWATL